MKVTTLECIEKRVKENAAKNLKTINDFETRLAKRELKKGRQRSKDATEEKILDSFKRK